MRLLNEVTGRVVTELESFGLSDAQIRDAIHPIGRHYYCLASAYVAPVRTELATKAIVSTVTHNLTGIVQLSAKKDLSYSELASSFAQFFGFSESLVLPTMSSKVKGLSFPRHTTLDSQGFLACNINQLEPLECLVDFRRCFC